jgi:hypothetical protein
MSSRHFRPWKIINKGSGARQAGRQEGNHFNHEGRACPNMRKRSMIAIARSPFNINIGFHHFRFHLQLLHHNEDCLSIIYFNGNKLRDEWGIKN